MKNNIQTKFQSRSCLMVGIMLQQYFCCVQCQTLPDLPSLQSQCLWRGALHWQTSQMYRTLSRYLQNHYAPATSRSCQSSWPSASSWWQSYKTFFFFIADKNSKLIRVFDLFKRNKLVFANASHLHPSLIFLGQVWEPTIRVESCIGNCVKFYYTFVNSIQNW